MIIRNPDDVTEAALAVMGRTHDPRLREIMTSLVEHLHGFVRDTNLTEAEYRQAAALLIEIGKQSHDSHNEMILMGGSLGLSALVCLTNNGDHGRRETSQNLLGPFWRLGAPVMDNGGSIVRSETPGPVLFVELKVRDVDGAPIPDALVDIWHSSPVGFYENQDETQADMNLRGRFTSDAEGRVWFRTVKPAGYPIPTDGVVGRLLAAQSRHPYRPAHLHALVYKEGFKTLTSQVYVDDDQYLETDVQFGVTRALIGDYRRHDGPHPSAPDVAEPWYSLDYVFTMEAGEARMPMPPIK